MSCQAQKHEFEVGDTVIVESDPLTYWLVSHVSSKRRSFIYVADVPGVKFQAATGRPVARQRGLVHWVVRPWSMQRWLQLSDTVGPPLNADNPPI